MGKDADRIINEMNSYFSDFSGADRIINDINASFANVQEAGIEMFSEIAKNHPEQAVKQFPEFMNRCLNKLGGGIFAGKMAGGPDYITSSSLINEMGIIYYHLPRELKVIGLDNTIKFLDGLNYFNAQNNVEMIKEPTLVSDILINRPEYWCGYEGFTEILKGKITWSDLEIELDENDRSRAIFSRSPFWFAFTLGREKYNNPHILTELTNQTPELINRTQDAIAAMIYDSSKRQASQYLTSQRKKEVIPFEEGVKNRLNHYIEEWRPALKEKLKEEKWTYLPRCINEWDFEKSRWVNILTSETVNFPKA